MPSIAEISAEYDRIAHLVLAGRHAEAEQLALDLRYILTKESGLTHFKGCTDNLLAQIAAHKSSNGSANGRGGPST